MLSRITQLINSVLAAEVEGCPVLSEQQVVELIDLGQSAGGASGRHWVLDPIDGTRGFVGMRQYSVCLGLLSEGEVVAGVLGCPNLPQGAVQDDDGGAGEGLRCAGGCGACAMLRQQVFLAHTHLVCCHHHH
jgi:3'(2'), 5'-bisphosphate nucleotidase/inositol polyphosphate 1-phosphatase